MNVFLQQCPVERLAANALVECIKLSILNEQFDTAFSLFQRLLSLPDAANYIDPEWLIRLSIQTGRQFLEKEVIKNLRTETLPTLDAQHSLHHSQYRASPTQGNSRSRWVETYLRDGNDHFYPVNIKGFTLRCPQEAAIYIFVSECASCKASYQFSVATTIAVDREFYCPTCFAKQKASYEDMRDYIVQHQPHSLADQIAHLDSGVNAIHIQLFNKAMDEENVPLLTKYLGQDYVVLLNQILIGRLSSEWEGRPQ